MSSLADRLGLKLGTMEIVLPTGKLYGPVGKVSVRPILTKDEKYITGIEEGNQQQGLRLLVNRLVIDPENFDIASYLDSDAIAILLTARSITYGDEIGVTVNCVCGESEQTSVEAGKLTLFKPRPKKKTFTKKLPNGLKVEYTLLTIGEKINIANELDQSHQLLGTLKQAGAEDLAVRYLASMINKILDKKGNEVELNVSERLEMVNELFTKADLDDLVEDIEKNQHPVNFEFNHKCKSCDKVEKQTMVIDYDFFFTGTSVTQSVPLSP